MWAPSLVILRSLWMQKALSYEDLELAVATMALLLELPLRPLHLVSLHQCFKTLEDTKQPLVMLNEAVSMVFLLRSGCRSSAFSSDAGTRFESLGMLFTRRCCIRRDFGSKCLLEAIVLHLYGRTRHFFFFTGSLATICCL